MFRPGRVTSPLILSALGVALIAGCKGSDPAEAARAARRQVKVAQDSAAGEIDATAKPTTIEEIVAQRVPEGSLGERVGPFETSTWQADATITSVELKKDGDFYLVLKGDKGGQTVMEVPDPELCKHSRFHDQIATTRKQLEEKYHPTPEPKELNDRAKVTGVGFLGWGKNSKGAKGKSGPRLMPGLGIDFEKR